MSGKAGSQGPSVFEGPMVWHKHPHAKVQQAAHEAEVVLKLGKDELVLESVPRGECLLRAQVHDVLRARPVHTHKHSNMVEVHLVERHRSKPVKGHSWKLASVQLQAHTAAARDSLVVALNEAIAARCMHRRPRNLRVYVNPHGGKHRAVKTWHEVHGLFDLAGVNVDVVVTQRANHARDEVLGMSRQELEGYDGLVAVGGDGMFAELVAGLLRRSDGVPPHLRLGVIPAGSTDTLAFSCTGTNKPQTLALHIILGEAQALDIMRVQAEGHEPVFASTFMGYGFYGEVIRRSESMRWLGPARYDVAGAKAFVKNQGWHASVSVPSDELPPHMASGKRSQLRDSIAHPPRPQDKDKDGAWTTISGKFICVNAANIPCNCEKAPQGVCPQAQLDDGKAHLILIRKTHRPNFLRHLTRIASSGDQFDFSFVETIPVSKFRVESHSHAHKKGFWNVDGELVDSSVVECTMLPRALRVFARPESKLAEPGAWPLS